jgi:dihydrofolate synthase / folylpolyglutamate synthase
MAKEDLYQTIVYTVNGEDLAVKCPLMGDYQKENIATVLAATSILAHQDPAITDSSIRTGIEKISQNMPLRGRWETLCEKPLTICDTAHNYDGIQQVCRQLMYMGKKPLHIVWGMVGDKDASSIIPLLPRDAEYFICAPSIPRAMPVETLAEYFAVNRLKYTLCETPKDALAMAQMSCGDQGMVFAGGSNFVVAEII